MGLLKKIQIIIGLSFTLFITVPTQAQITFDDDVDDTTPGAPIDGLLGLGIAGGAIYGIKKLRQKSK